MIYHYRSNGRSFIVRSEMLPLIQIHIMKLYHAYLLVILVISLISCGEEKNTKVDVISKEGAFISVITHSAGDSWETSFGFLPLPVNIGTVNNKEVLVLCDRRKTGEKINILPLGAVRLIENDSLRTYVLGIPTDKELTTISAKGFDEFSTVHSSAKWIIEQYLINRKGENKVVLKSWENEKTAINYLQN